MVKEMGRENKKWRRCQLAIAQVLYVSSLVFQLSVFLKLRFMNTLYIFSFCYVSHAVISGRYPSVVIS